MSIIMLCPKKCGTAYETAADAFKKMYRLTTGNEINASEEDDGKSDLVIIGSDAVNDFLLNEMLDRNVPDLGIRYGTDDYRCKTYRKGTRRVLILAGGRHVLLSMLCTAIMKSIWMPLFLGWRRDTEQRRNRA